MKLFTRNRMTTVNKVRILLVIIAILVSVVLEFNNYEEIKQNKIDMDLAYSQRAEHGDNRYIPYGRTTYSPGEASLLVLILTAILLFVTYLRTLLLYIAKDIKKFIREVKKD